MFKKLPLILISIVFITCTFAFANIAHAGLIPRPTNNLGLVGYWSMNEATGTQVGDMSGTGNDGTMKNMDPATDWVDGRHGQALDFDGSNDYVSMSEVLGTADTYTLSAWVYFHDLSSNNGIFATDWDSTRGYIIETVDIGSTGKSNFRIYHKGDNDTKDSIYAADNALSENTWHFVVAIRSGSGAANLNLFIDGVDVSTSIYINQGANSVSTASTNYIGKSFTRYFDGTIDQVRIYNRALSSTTIKAHYNRGAARLKQTNRKGLVGHWKFDEGRGQTAGDSSFETNPGTLQGDPQWTDGRYGKALKFDGVDDYVDVGDRDSLEFGQKFTIEFWFKLGALGSSRTFISKVNNNGMYDNKGYLVRKRTNDWIEIKLGNGSASQLFTLYRTPEKDTWYHAVWTGNGSKIRGYMNGGALAEKEWNQPNIVHCNGDFRLGSSVSAYRLNGSLDEVRIYNRALSAEEIKNLYQETQPKVNTSQNKKLTDGLVGMWSFNGKDLTTATATDVSTNNNDGTLGATTAQESSDPQPTIGKVGQALEFDGVDDYVDLVLSALYGINSTDSLWVYPKNMVDLQMLLGEGDNGYDYHIYFYGSDNLYYHVGSTAHSDYILNFGTHGITEGQWNYLAFVRSGDNVSYYLNGEFQSTESPASSWGSTESAIDRIGAESDAGASYPFNGTIDEVRIYDRALSADEIQRLYRMGH